MLKGWISNFYHILLLKKDNTHFYGLAEKGCIKVKELIMAVVVSGLEHPAQTQHGSYRTEEDPKTRAGKSEH